MKHRNETPSSLSRPGALIQRYRAILREGAWAIGGQVLTAIFGLGGNRLITEYVNPEVYGLVSLFQQGALLLRALFCSPFLGAGLRFFQEAERGKYVTRLRQLLAHNLALTAVAMEILAVGFGLFWTRKLGITPWVVVALALYAAADVARTLETTLFSAARRQRPFAVLSAAEALLRPILVVGGVILFGATISVVLGALAGSIIITLLGLYVFFGRNAAGSDNPVPPAIVVEMKRFALPLIPIALLNWTTSASDRYIIEWLTHDSASVGVYSAGYALISQPLNMLQGIIVMVLRPVYFGVISRNDDVSAERTFRVWLGGSAAACLFVASLFILTREFIVDTFLGPRYRGAVAMVPWIALGYVLYAIEQVIEQKLLARKRSIAVLVAQGCGAVASIVVTIPLVRAFGMIGAAYACPIYFLIQCTVASLLLRTPATDSLEGSGSS